MCGACDSLGEWNPEKALPMSDAGYPVWKINIDLSRTILPIEFKFIVLDKDTRALKAWDGGDNRRLASMTKNRHVSMVVSGMRFRDPRALWRGA